MVPTLHAHGCSLGCVCSWQRFPVCSGSSLFSLFLKCRGRQQSLLAAAGCKSVVVDLLAWPRASFQDSKVVCVCVWGGALATKGSFCFTISRCRKGNRLDFVESSLTYRKLADCWRVPRLFHGSPVLPSGGGVTCLAELVWTLLPTDIPSPHESGLLELHVLWTLLQSMHPTTSPIAAPY